MYKQRGFGFIGILVIVLTLTTIGGAGYYVYNKNREENIETTDTTQFKPEASNDNQTESSDSKITYTKKYEELISTLGLMNSEVQTDKCSFNEPGEPECIVYYDIIAPSQGDEMLDKDKYQKFVEYLLSNDWQGEMWISSEYYHDKKVSITSSSDLIYDTEFPSYSTVFIKNNKGIKQVIVFSYKNSNKSYPFQFYYFAEKV